MTVAPWLAASTVLDPLHPSSHAAMALQTCQARMRPWDRVSGAVDRGLAVLTVAALVSCRSHAAKVEALLPEPHNDLQLATEPFDVPPHRRDSTVEVAALDLRDVALPDTAGLGELRLRFS